VAVSKTAALQLHSVACNQWRNQPKNWGGGKMIDFRRIALFFLEKRLSQHKITIFFKNLGGHGPFGPILATSMLATTTDTTSLD